MVAVAVVVMGLSRPQKFRRLAAQAGAAGPALVARDRRRHSTGGALRIVHRRARCDGPQARLHWRT